MVRFYELTWREEITVLGIFCRSSLFGSKSGLPDSWYIQLLLSSEGLNTLTVKCFRRKVWETRHSGVTGWELLSHFSDVWCSSLLQLARSSVCQRESLFLFQMRQWWMYVSNNSINYENRSGLTLFYIIFHEQLIKLTQRLITPADNSHCEAIHCHRNIKFLPPSLHRLPYFICYLY